MVVVLVAHFWTLRSDACNAASKEAVLIVIPAGGLRSDSTQNG